MMLRVLASVMLPLTLAVALFVFVRGHMLPGGGFVAALVTTVALILIHAANGTEWAAARLPIDYSRVMAIGVIVAAATGVASLAFGRPFLTSAHGHPHLPVVGDIPLASAMAFDLGVYLTVVGVAMLVLERLGRLGLEPAGTASPER